MFQEMNDLLESAVSVIVPNTALGQFIAENAFLTLTVAAVVLIVAFLLAAFFFDFVSDAWKLPFAAGVDLLKYMGLFQPWLGVVSALAGAVVFYALSDTGPAKWLFVALSIAVAVMSMLWSNLVIGVIIAIAPINTIMMFIATIVD